MANAVDVLKAARELIAKPGGWTQGQYARDEDGGMVDEKSPLAVCFCSDGALSRALARVPDATYADFDKALEVLSKAAGVDNIVHWNDAPGRTQAEVVAAFDAAIAKASA